jgi:hypothetical protein
MFTFGGKGVVCPFFYVYFLIILILLKQEQKGQTTPLSPNVNIGQCREE